MLAAALLVGLCGLTYLMARQTSMFAVRSVVVSGASEQIRGEVGEALAAFDGKSLVSLDPGDVAARIERLPSVISATVDRDFPATLRVAVRPERPVAVVRQGDTAWLVSARGRIVRQVEPGQETRLARVWLTPAQATLRVGTYLLADEGAAAIRALARVPRGFPMRIDTATGTPDDLMLVLGSKTQIRLGTASDLGLKLQVAATVLRRLNAAERSDLAYLDVSIPTRPVGSQKSQVED